MNGKEHAITNFKAQLTVSSDISRAFQALRGGKFL
jgi:hypothetical protein